LNESDTGLHYYEVRPDERLRPFVRCIWGLRGPAPREIERVLPDGCCEFILHCGDPFTQHGSHAVKVQPREMFVGPSQHAICIQPGAIVDVIAIRFRPGGAAVFLRGPLVEYRENVLSRDTCGTDFGFGFDAIDALAALTDAERVRLLERELLARTATLRVDAAVRHARRRIAETYGAVRVEILASETGLTMRQLQRRFDTVVGLTPKALARVVRLQRAIALARDGRATLARIAAAAGYADQAHFNRQFREIAGVTPTEFFREQNRLDEFFAGE
jgi:AraC-like DNA-binding protein